MQMGLALLAFIFAIPWMPINYAIYNMGHTCLGVLSTQYKSSIAKERFRKSLNEEKAYPEALTTAVVDFQKAQCFFMLATNIAGLVTPMRGGLQPQSFQQIYNTYIFIKTQYCYWWIPPDPVHPTYLAHDPQAIMVPPHPIRDNHRGRSSDSAHKEPHKERHVHARCQRSQPHHRDRFYGWTSHLRIEEPNCLVLRSPKRLRLWFRSRR